MAPQNQRIVTLRDIGTESSAAKGINDDEPDPPAKNASLPSSLSMAHFDYCQPALEFKPASTASPKSPIQPVLHHITNLPMADACRQMLERILNEFLPIIQRRQYHVRSISEMCCCGDGLDETLKATRKKMPKQSNNVLGYNQTTTTRRGKFRTSSHTIHLRLRQPRHHSTQLLPWEDVAGTMAHELSHCVHQNHSKAFYQLMEEILDEHSSLQLHKMGGLIFGHREPTPAPRLPMTEGQRLGGNQTGKSRLLTQGGQPFSSNTHPTLLSPQARREAMVRAAEQRRRQMEQHKRLLQTSKEPCVIEILEDDEQSNEDPDIIELPAPVQKKREPFPTTRKKPNRKQQTLEVLDLSTPVAKKPKAQEILVEAIDLTCPENRTVGIHGNDDPEPSSQEREEPWTCHRCTFFNQALALMCTICHAEREREREQTTTEDPVPSASEVVIID